MEIYKYYGIKWSHQMLFFWYFPMIDSLSDDLHSKPKIL